MGKLVRIDFGNGRSNYQDDDTSLPGEESFTTQIKPEAAAETNRITETDTSAGTNLLTETDTSAKAATISQLTEATRIQAMLRIPQQPNGQPRNQNQEEERIARGLETLAAQLKQGKTLKDFGVSPHWAHLLLMTYERIPTTADETQDIEVIKILKKQIIEALTILCKEKTATQRDVNILTKLWRESFPEEQEQSGLTDTDFGTFKYEAVTRKAGEYLQKCLSEDSKLPGGDTRNLYKALEELEQIWPDTKTFPGKTRHEVKRFIGHFLFEPELEEQFKTILESFGIQRETFMSVFGQELAVETQIAGLIFNFAAQGQRELRDLILNLTEAGLDGKEFEMIKTFLQRLDEDDKIIGQLLAQCRSNRFDNLPELTNRLHTIPLPFNTHLRPYAYFGTSEEELKVFTRRAALKTNGAP